MMNVNSLEYIDINFKIEFEKPFLFFTLPTFVFRSILGAQLKNLVCINQQSKNCSDCQFKNTCAYAIIFESIIDKNTKILAGRNRASHPFRLKPDTTLQDKKVIKQYNLGMQLYGFAIKYLPYIFYAIQKAGLQGLFKEKIKYTISEVLVNEKNILLDNGNLNTNFKINEWQNNKLINTEKIFINILSPLRFKVDGSYMDKISAIEFFKCIYRRNKTILGFYGNKISEKDYVVNRNLKIKDDRIQVKEYIYHSHRQDAKIKLIGFVGSFAIEGNFTEQEQGLIDFANFFGAGKSTAFGFGNLEILY